MVDLNLIAERLMAGKFAEVKDLTQTAVDEGAPIKEILEQGMISGMNAIGKKFKANEVFVPEVLIAARAMHAGMEVLEPLLAEAGIEPIGKIAVGTVKGDLHDIGKNLVIMMLKGAGFEVIDLGTDVPADKFIKAAKEQNVQAVAMSALLTTTMPAMKESINALSDAGARESVKVLVGGAPVTPNYAAEIGADGYAPDAASAVDKAKELLGLN